MNPLARRRLFTLTGAGALALALRPAARPSPAAAAPFLSTALAQLDGIAEQALQRIGVPGMAVAVVAGDEMVYARGFGVREAASGGPVLPETVFQIASLSKPLASTVVAAVAGDGALRWDDPVVQHDPGFEMYDSWVTRQVTFKDFFCHRSGLPEYAGDFLEDMGYDRQQVLYRLRYLKPVSSFRSAYAYTNFGLTEAGVAAAKAAGTTWEDLAETRLYRPLGMTSTSSRFRDYIARPDRAWPHVRDGGRWVSKFQRQPDPQSPAGGVSSNVIDLARWMRLQLGRGVFEGRRIVAQAPLDETHRPQIVSRPAPNPYENPTGFYGLGWNVSYDDAGRLRLGHSGAFSLGTGTNVALIPALGLGIVALTNGAANGVAEAVTAGFLDVALTGRITRDWAAVTGPAFVAIAEQSKEGLSDFSTPPARVMPALPDAAYVGTYTSDLYGPVTVAAQGGGLVMLMGPDRTAYPLRHWDRDVFTYLPPGENFAGPSGVIFQVGADGRAGSVTVEQLNRTGQGTFPRAAMP
jgi:CubicO group peptidase (beta-lactamase class C family)